MSEVTEEGIEKIYYSISEVANKLDVKPSLIRFWENQFVDIIKPKKNKKGVRQFTKTDIEKLQTIFYLVKEKGFTIQGAKDWLKDKPKIQETTILIQKLEQTKAFLLKIKGLIEEMEKIQAQKTE
ncbi:MAG: MerR family transcriptional regulator [Flammeovirgaceae bacterium]